MAGGRSRRMGRDKALLPWAEGTLLDHAVGRLREAAAEVRVLCGARPRYLGRGVPVEIDAVREAGALGGLLTGLARLRSGPGLFLAVDLPGAGAGLLRRLVELCAGCDAVVPVTASGPEPLCACYGPGCLEPVRGCLERGDLKMTAFWPSVRVREVREAELREFGDPALMFRNLNTPGDYDALRAPRP
jgi:molybdopterin-guanine dinucleotide biosynthesis protein A